MKEIYIILTHTGTLPSRIIKSFTRDEFSHASISLDIELNEMYSFARLRKYNFLNAGFVHENIKEGTFKRFYKTKAKIYSLQVTDEQYENIKNAIEQIWKNKEEYKFNILGLCAVSIHKRVKREHYFYCAEFVKYVLEKAGIKTGLPDIVKPEDFKKINGLKQIYSGYLRKYKSSKTKLSEILKSQMSLANKRQKMV